MAIVDLTVWCGENPHYRGTVDESATRRDVIARATAAARKWRPGKPPVPRSYDALATPRRHRKKLWDWAREIGSKSKTMPGRIRAIQSKPDAAAKLFALWYGAPADRRSGGKVLGTAHPLTALYELRERLNIHSIRADRGSWYTWYRVARALKSQRYIAIAASDIPRPTILWGDRIRQAHEVYVVPGRVQPGVYGHGHSFRWRGTWKSAPGSYQASDWRGVVGIDVLRRWLAAPGSIESSAALLGECARYDRAQKIYHRWRWDVQQGWTPSGVAVPMPEDLRDRYGRWEHGADVSACQAEIARKWAAVAAEAEQRRLTARDQRAVRLLARVGHRVPVTAADVRGVGACDAGIEAWCRARGVDPSSTLPLADLAQDRQASKFALLVAARIWRAHRQQRQSVA